MVLEPHSLGAPFTLQVLGLATVGSVVRGLRTPKEFQPRAMPRSPESDCT